MNETEGVHLSTDGVTVETAAVSLKVVRVGKRQMTLSVFRQLPCEHLIDPDTLLLRGMPWGTVNYFWDGCGLCGVAHLHVVWSREGRLFRDCVGKIVWRKSAGDFDNVLEYLAWGDPSGLRTLKTPWQISFSESGFTRRWEVCCDRCPAAEVVAWNAVVAGLEVIDQLFIAV